MKPQLAFLSILSIFYILILTSIDIDIDVMDMITTTINIIAIIANISNATSGLLM